MIAGISLAGLEPKEPVHRHRAFAGESCNATILSKSSWLWEIRGRPKIGHARIVWMNCHLHANFLAYRNDSIQEVLVILTQHIRGNALVLLQSLLQLCQTLWLPAWKCKAMAVLCSFS